MAAFAYGSIVPLSNSLPLRLGGRNRRKQACRSAFAVAMADPEAWQSGRVLGPADAGSDWWDKLMFSGGVVVEQAPGHGFRMYYYGRGGPQWNQGVEPFNASLPTGRVGLAVSADGTAFQRFRGPLPAGAVLDPASDPAAFDSVHIGVSDVVREPGADAWLMFYFGGGMEEVALPFLPKPARGVKLRPGLARSRDGLQWDREQGQGPLLELGAAGEWDQNGVSWPRVLPPAGPGEGWLMTYHTREVGGPKGVGFFSAGLAMSPDGRKWEKRGMILTAGEPGSWDEGGVSVRHVLKVEDGFVMFYEGSNYAFDFAVGLATSKDGVVWEKDLEAGPEPGGPVLRARKGEDVWDNVIVGTPYVVKREDGSLYMYYLGVGKKEGGDGKFEYGIGLAVSHLKQFRTWKRFGE